MTTTRGTVRSWNDEEGWGVIDAPTLPGGVFAHYSALTAPPGTFRALTAGEPVEFSWEPGPQDGCAYRATGIRRPGTPPAAPEQEEPEQAVPEQAGGYTSELFIDFDDDGSTWRTR
jgi:CspA family cold shock protein